MPSSSTGFACQIFSIFPLQEVYAPGQEYSVTIPLCLDEVDLAGWKQCSCELETRYYNQQGKDCFLGTLRGTSRIVL